MSLTRTTSSSHGTDALEADPEARSVHLITFGCQMNKYDSNLVEGRFRARGWRVADSVAEADVVLFNTCSVREHAEERVYSWLGELKAEKKRRPELVLGVMGCLAQRAQEEVFRRAGHVDLVVGTRRLQHMPVLVDEVYERRADPNRGRSKAELVLDVEMDDEVAVPRAGEVYTGGLCGYLTVMRGCDLNCAYCIVPKTRGRVQSQPIPALVEEARWMVAQGARVITLLGQTVDSYGEDLPVPAEGEPRGTGRQGRPSLADLLRALNEVEGLVRIRLITLHPSYVSPALAESIADCGKVERFLPLPAQSGSDGVLRAMRRGYTTDLYRKRIGILRDRVPDIELGSDWIVGFPGESEADHLASEAFLAEVGFVVNYIFKYDPRPETRAYDLADDVETATKKSRNQALLAAAHKVQFERMQRYVGQLAEVFVEQESEKRKGWLQGRSKHGIPVSFVGAADEIGTEVTVRVTDSSPFGLAGVREAD